MQSAYTGETQRLVAQEDPTTFLTHLLAQAPQADRHTANEAYRNIKAQAELISAAREYINAARLFLEDFAKFQATAEQYPHIPLPPHIAAFLREVQR